VAALKRCRSGRQASAAQIQGNADVDAVQTQSSANSTEPTRHDDQINK